MVLPFTLKQNNYELSIDLNSHVADMQYVSGDYAVDILVGDDDIKVK